MSMRSSQKLRASPWWAVGVWGSLEGGIELGGGRVRARGRICDSLARRKVRDVRGAGGDGTVRKFAMTVVLCVGWRFWSWKSSWPCLAAPRMLPRGGLCVYGTCSVKLTPMCLVSEHDFDCTQISLL